jgi:hypothetical protein
MNPRERILALLNKGTPDRIPFAHCDRHLPRGEKERKARNMGMGLLCYRPCYTESRTRVKVTTQEEPGSVITTYTTPIGSLTEVMRVGAGYGQALFGRDWRGIQPLRTQYLVKKPEDYRILRFIIENIHYEPYYYALEDQLRRLGDDGIVIATLPYEPMQRLLVTWVGSRLYIDLRRNREEVEDVCNALELKYEEELFPIAAASPSEVIAYGGNIDSVLVSPTMFESYYLPAYDKCWKAIRPEGKLLNVHMDGKLKALTELIAGSKVDIIEAVTPPPMGDLPLDRALSAWKEKITWVNFPSAISTALGPRPLVVKGYLIDQLERTIPSERVMVIASTENFVPEENVIAMAEVMEQATLPLSKQVIERMRMNAS